MDMFDNSSIQLKSVLAAVLGAQSGTLKALTFSVPDDVKPELMKMAANIQELAKEVLAMRGGQYL